MARLPLQRFTDASLSLVPTAGLRRAGDTGTMTSTTPTVSKPLPIEQSFTSLEDAFEQALALEVMLAQHARVKEAAARSAAKPD